MGVGRGYQSESRGREWAFDVQKEKQGVKTKTIPLLPATLFFPLTTLSVFPPAQLDVSTSSMASFVAKAWSCMRLWGIVDTVYYTSTGGWG